MCRECGKAMEIVKHILKMCEPKGFSLYKERHDRAILIVLLRRLKEYGFKQEEPWYKLEAKPVYENRSVKILWDPSIPTDEEMTERRPDLVVEDWLCKSICSIEMSVPTDSNINGRWQEKFQKYQKLAADMRKQFRGYRIKVVPMIIGAFRDSGHAPGRPKGNSKAVKRCSRSDESDAENCSLLGCKDIEATSIC